MPTTITGSKKRQSEHISEDMVNNNKHAGFSPCSRSASSTTCSGSPGLDWDLAKAPDQTQADYLPTPFRPSDRLQYTGEYYDQPSLEDDRDLGEFTHWVLARIKNMVVSNTMAKMLDDPHLSTKWNISPKTRYKDQVRCFQEIKLGNAPVTNHEATTKRRKIGGVPAAIPASTPTPDIPLPAPDEGVKPVAEQKPTGTYFEADFQALKEELLKFDGYLQRVQRVLTAMENNKPECNRSPLPET